MYELCLWPQPKRHCVLKWTADTCVQHFVSHIVRVCNTVTVEQLPLISRDSQPQRVFRIVQVNKVSKTLR